MKSHTSTYLILSTILISFCHFSYSQWNSTASNRSIYYNGDYVGIGTSNPQYPVDLYSPFSVSLMHMSNNTSSVSQFGLNGFVFGPSGANVVFNNFEQGNIEFSTGSLPNNNSRKMIILANGNVGIGLPTPTSKLDVAGTITTQGLKISAYAAAGRVLTSDASGNASWTDVTPYISGWSTNGADSYKSSGNVGIGMNNPSAKLHVDGTIKLGATTAEQVLIGKNGFIDVYNSNNKFIVGYNHPLNRVTFYASNFNVEGNVQASGELSVCGNIHAGEVVVESGWCDYVFSNDYALMPLEQVAEFIDENHHLPNIPSAATVEENGLHIADMQKRMMEKIEELTLHAITQQKQMELQLKYIEILEKEILDVKLSR